MSDLMEKLRIEWITEGLEEGERKGHQMGLEEGERKGHQMGLKEGERKGLKSGKYKTTQLFALLLKENRMTDLNRCIADPSYLDRLLDELVPSKD